MNKRRTFLALSGITALYVLTGCSDANTGNPGDGNDGGDQSWRDGRNPSYT